MTTKQKDALRNWARLVETKAQALRFALPAEVSASHEEVFAVFNDLEDAFEKLRAGVDTIEEEGRL